VGLFHQVYHFVRKQGDMHARACMCVQYKGTAGMREGEVTWMYKLTQVRDDDPGLIHHYKTIHFGYHTSTPS